jgi:hypothetical protein
VGYVLKAGIGLVLFLGGIILFNVKLLDTLEIGTCASGNTPYQISQPCPEGTGTTILLMMAGIFGGLIGAGIFAFRGEAPWGSGKRRFGGSFGFGTLAWGLFFTATGATCLIAALSDDSLSAGSDLGGKIVGVTFLVMGLPALLISIWGFVKSFGSRDERPAAAATSGGGSKMPWGTAGSGGGGGRKAGDSIGKLERLQKLREDGALSDAEFEREKAKILAEQ